MFEAATAFKAAFYSLLNSKSPNFGEVKTHVSVPICLHLKNTLYSSLPSLRISFWAWADMQVKITHALPDVRDLRTSGNGCYQSRPFLRPRDQKKRRLWGREWCVDIQRHPYRRACVQIPNIVNRGPRHNNRTYEKFMTLCFYHALLYMVKIGSQFFHIPSTWRIFFNFRTATFDDRKDHIEYWNF